MNNEDICIHLKDVHFGWQGSEHPLLVIPQLSIKKGQRIFIHGPSGSGKSTLLNLLTGVLSPRAGTVTVLEQNLTKLRQHARDRLRVDHMGIIFQQFNLLPYLSILENVTLPCSFSKRRKQLATANGTLHQEAARLLHALGLSDLDLTTRKTAALSTGQQQRVAAARALIGAPEIIIADEPTSALDYDAKQNFLRLLFSEIDRLGSTLLFVSHDRTLDQQFQCTVALHQLNQATQS